MSVPITKIAFAGGGSGGHVYPLLSVAREIKKLVPGADCIFVSTHGSVEEKIVPRDGFPLLMIPSGKMKGQGILTKISTVIAMISGIFASWRIIRQHKPQLVFSAGGYAGAPFLLAAALCGIPCAVLEQNLVPGLANKLMTKFSRKVFLNFAGSAQYFPGKDTEVVGHPCREEIEAARWSESDLDTKMNAVPMQVFVFGGSQGAVAINRLIVGALPFLKELEDKIHILHQTGVNDLPTVQSGYASAGYKNAKVDAYIYDMASAYQNTQLIICRAGASSLAELAAAGKAALLIPLVSKDRHQEFNAEELARLEAAASYLQPTLSGEKLAAIIKDFYYNRAKLVQYSQKISRLHHPGAAKRIAEQCISIINAKSIS
jgi:UDP-N-acetylglucosamine--N-acetylmuramyl-(pentapeptide) pyrophosphoryl-undecaprenol N-acetylglucosamine transferase